MNAFLAFFFCITLAQIGRAGAQIGEITEAGPGSYILCLEYTFDDEHAFENVDLKTSDHYSGRMLSVTRSWIGDRSPKGKYLSLFLVTAKKDGTAIRNSDFIGLPTSSKFEFTLTKK